MRCHGDGATLPSLKATLLHQVWKRLLFLPHCDTSLANISLDLMECRLDRAAANTRINQMIGIGKFLIKLVKLLLQLLEWTRLLYVSYSTFYWGVSEKNGTIVDSLTVLVYDSA